MVPLPRTPSVNHLLQQYHSDMRTERKGMSEVVHGIQAYFDKALPNILLYKEERAQVRNFRLHTNMHRPKKNYLFK